MHTRLIIIFLFLFSNSLAEEIYGIPKIVDGDTVHIDNYKFREVYSLTEFVFGLFLND